MALARIITNSEVCSRELALNLVERGYAVEIVSPDAIPDNFADLELRVETGPADVLNASVEARDKTHITKLQFIHQLKPSLLEVERPSIADSGIAVPGVTIPALTISANPVPARAPRGPIPISTSAVPLAMPGIGEEPQVRVAPADSAVTTTPADPPKKPSAFSEGASVLVMPSQSSGSIASLPSRISTLDPQFGEGYGLSMPMAFTPAEMAATPDAAVMKFIIRKPSFPSVRIPRFKLRSWRTVFRRIMLWVVTPWRLLIARASEIRGARTSQARQLGLTVLTFAAVITFALALSLGPRRIDSSRPDAAAGDHSGTENVNGFFLLAPTPEKTPDAANLANAKPSALRKSGMSETPVDPAVPAAPASEKIGKQISTAKEQNSLRHKSKAAAPRAAKAHRHSEDVIAPDTIIYFDRPGASPVPVKKLTRGRAESQKPGEGPMAASSLHAKSIPQTASGK